MAADGDIHRRRLHIVLGDEGTVIPDEGSEALHRDEVSESEGNAGVHHRNALAGHLQGGDGTVYGGTEGHHSVHRLRDLDHGHVAAKGSAAVQGLRLRQMCGKIVRHAGLDAGAQVGTDEKTLVEERSGIFSAAVGGRAFRMKVVEVDIREFTGPAAQGLDEDVRNTGDAGEVDVVSAAHRTDGLFGRYEY